MADEKVTRRLAAVFAADMVGYSRLMEVDEAGTIARQKAHRKALIDPEIAAHDGRIVKTMGDGLLVEFPSVVDAVACAVAIQRAMVDREAGIADDRRIRYRVGINLGDIVIDGDDILGDGVNVAARLESLAEPGGICIPRKVFHEVRNKLDVGYAYIGEQKVKNIETPVPVYRVLLEPNAAGQVIAKGWLNRPRLQIGAAAAAGIATVAIVVAALWWQPWLKPVDRVDPAKITQRPTTKPSIAVLPFENLSSDESQEYFADGMTEDLIIDLSRYPSLFVIGRNSVFTYKDKAIDARDVGRELGVRYILEGSVRKSAERVRITAKLIEAESGESLWAERYDRLLNDIFALQEEVSGEIVSALAVNLSEADRHRRLRHETKSLEAYDLALRARKLLASYKWKPTQRAEALLQRAIALDPNYARAKALLGELYFGYWRLWGQDRQANLAKALKLGKEAVELDENNANAHMLLATVYQWSERYDLGDVAADKVLTLEPSDAQTLANLGSYLRLGGRPEQAIAALERSIRLDPHANPHNLAILGHAYCLAGQYNDAIRILKRGVERKPNLVPFQIFLALAYARLNMMDAAAMAANRALELNPNFTLRAYANFMPYRNEAEEARDVASMAAAGLPK